MYDEDMEVNMITIKDFRESDIPDYLSLEQEVKTNMDHPEWLGDFSKNDLQKLFKIGGHIYGGYIENKPENTLGYHMNYRTFTIFC